jgi:hypothetical protein
MPGNNDSRPAIRKDLAKSECACLLVQIPAFFCDCSKEL